MGRENLAASASPNHVEDDDNDGKMTTNEGVREEVEELVGLVVLVVVVGTAAAVIIGRLQNVWEEKKMNNRQ